MGSSRKKLDHAQPYTRMYFFIEPVKTTKYDGREPIPRAGGIIQLPMGGGRRDRLLSYSAILAAA